MFLLSCCMSAPDPERVDANRRNKTFKKVAKELKKAVSNKGKHLKSFIQKQGSGYQKESSTPEKIDVRKKTDKMERDVERLESELTQPSKEVISKVKKSESIAKKASPTRPSRTAETAKQTTSALGKQALSKDQIKMARELTKTAEKVKSGQMMKKEEKPRKQEEEFPWMAIEDVKTGRMYYYNKVTKESIWNKPKGFDEMAKKQAQREKKERGIVNWVETKDSKGRTYYYDSQTRESRWDRPATFEVKRKATSTRKSKLGKRSSKAPPQDPPPTAPEDPPTAAIPLDQPFTNTAKPRKKVDFQGSPRNNSKNERVSNLGKGTLTRLGQLPSSRGSLKTERRASSFNDISYEEKRASDLDATLFVNRKASPDEANDGDETVEYDIAAVLAEKKAQNTRERARATSDDIRHGEMIQHDVHDMKRYYAADTNKLMEESNASNIGKRESRLGMSKQKNSKVALAVARAEKLKKI